MHIFAFYNNFSAHPDCGAMFQTLYFQNGMFFRYIWSICEKTARDIKLSSMDRYLEISYGLFINTKISPQLHSHLAVENAKIGISTFK